MNRYVCTICDMFPQTESVEETRQLDYMQTGSSDCKNPTMRAC